MIPTTQECREALEILLTMFQTVAGFKGAGVGEGCIRAYVASPSDRELIPSYIGDVPVEVVVTGDIVSQ